MREVDWMWCYENPKEAAAEIDQLRAKIDAAIKILSDARFSHQSRTNDARSVLSH